MRILRATLNATVFAAVTVSGGVMCGAEGSNAQLGMRDNRSIE